MSAEELSDAPSELSAAHSEGPVDPIECEHQTMLENRTLLPFEKIVSEIPNTVPVCRSLRCSNVEWSPLAWYCSQVPHEYSLPLLPRPSAATGRAGIRMR